MREKTKKVSLIALKELAKAALALLKWLALGVFTGVVVGFVGAGFAHVLVQANNLRSAYPLIILGLPVGGLVIVMLYRGAKSADDRGTNTVVASIQEGSPIPIKMAPLIFVSTAITQLFGGSAGREGAALQLGGSLAKQAGKIFRLDENDQRIMVMCGMSAGFSALFGTPMAAAVFAMEVVMVGTMQYGALVPCVSASVTAHFIARLCKVPPEVFPVTAVPDMHILPFLGTVAFAAAAGALSIGFCVLLHKCEHLYERYIKNQYLRIALAGCLVLLLTLCFGNGYLGSGMHMIEEIFHHGSTAYYAFALKMLFTALTLGAGFKGGEIVPTLTVGAAFGCCVAMLFGLNVPLLAACGMVGLFCGVTNSPLTSLLLGLELFGAAGMPYYLITVAVSYLISGRESLYKQQKLLCEKTSASFSRKGA